MQKQNKKKERRYEEICKEKFDEKTKIMMPFQPVQPICDSTRTLPS